MKILVTGATGRLGSRLVPRLLLRGDSVRVLARNPVSTDSFRKQGLEIAIGDLLDGESLARAVHGVEAVVHLAAYFRGATPDEVQKVNLDGTLALAQATVDGNVNRFVFASTNLVYGPGHGTVFQEQAPPQPDSPYPVSKFAAEQALMKFHQTQGLDLRILRLAFVYGEGDPHLAEGLRWFRQWNPNQQMHLVHHADVAQATILALNTPGIDGEIYNVADNEPVAVGEIMRLYGENIAEEALIRPLIPAWHQLVDTGKIRNELGFHPIYPALRDAVSAGRL